MPIEDRFYDFYGSSVFQQFELHCCIEMVLQVCFHSACELPVKLGEAGTGCEACCVKRRNVWLHVTIVKWMNLAGQMMRNHGSLGREWSMPNLFTNPQMMLWHASYREQPKRVCVSVCMCVSSSNFTELRFSPHWWQMRCRSKLIGWFKSNNLQLGVNRHIAITHPSRKRIDSLPSAEEGFY